MIKGVVQISCSGQAQSMSARDHHHGLSAATGFLSSTRFKIPKIFMITLGSTLLSMQTCINMYAELAVIRTKADKMLA